MSKAYRSFRSILVTAAAAIGAVQARAQQRRLDRQHADRECYRGDPQTSRDPAFSQRAV